MIFLLFVSLIGYFLFIARICKWPIAITPLFTVCLIPSLLYIAGIFNMLAISAHLLFYAGFAFLLVYLFLCFKERRIPYEEIFSTDFSLEKIKNTFSRHNSAVRDKETLHNFIKALYEEPSGKIFTRKIE